MPAKKPTASELTRKVSEEPLARDQDNRVPVTEPPYRSVDAAWEMVIAKAAEQGRKISKPPSMTDHNIDGICWQVSDGLFLEHAAPLFGVNGKLALLWVEKAEKWLEKAIKAGEIVDVPDDLLPYSIFAQKYRYHEALSIMFANASVQNREDNWKAQAWWLSVRFPDQYGKRLKTEHSGTIQTAVAYVPVRKDD